MTSRRKCWSIDKVLMEKGTLNLLKRAVEQEYPKEACGVLLGSIKTAVNEVPYVVEEIKPVTNHADDVVSGWYFQVDPIEIHHLELQAEKEGKQIVGFYHSHPDAPAELSAEDERFFIPGMIYVIIAVDGERAREIRTYFRARPDEEIAEMGIFPGEEVK